ncbi:hypothetical protein JOM56_014168 [Amanita muscaria]
MTSVWSVTNFGRSGLGEKVGSGTSSFDVVWYEEAKKSEEAVDGKVKFVGLFCDWLDGSATGCALCNWLDGSATGSVLCDWLDGSATDLMLCDWLDDSKNGLEQRLHGPATYSDWPDDSFASHGVWCDDSDVDVNESHRNGQIWQEVFVHRQWMRGDGPGAVGAKNSGFGPRKWMDGKGSHWMTCAAGLQFEEGVFGANFELMP